METYVIYVHMWKDWICVLATPWTVAHQAPLSIGFAKLEHWSVPFPSPGDLPDSEFKLASPALAEGFFPPEPAEKPMWKDTKFET